MTRSTPLLAAPRVRLAHGLASRLEALVRAGRGVRERGEPARRAQGTGAGDEFVGYRPYQPGEDVRHLDWSLLARLEQPFVRVHRREAGERWRVLLDASGSMGLGAPGKLQLGAELALGLAALGQGLGARVELLAGRAQGAPLALSYTRRGDLLRWREALESLEAREGSVDSAAGLPALLARETAGRRRIDRLFLIGDLLELEPRRVLALQRPGRRLDLVQLLAPHELDPQLLGLEAAGWVDREEGARLECALGERELAHYGEALTRRLEAWRRSCARHGLAWSVWSSATPFEDVARSLLEL